MKPSVFISSTVKDLRPIRDAAREVVIEMGYEPMMSEYNEVGYMDGGSAVDACYGSVCQCQIMVLIIGKKYGGMSEQVGLSVTEREWETAIDAVPHIITLVDREVLNYRQVYEDNKMVGKLKFSEMDNPQATFSFINKVMAMPRKNGIIPFSSTTDVRIALKKQFAALFYSALTDKAPKTTEAINDILYEIKALRAAREEVPNERSKSVSSYLKVLRILMSTPNDSFVSFLKGMAGEIERAVPMIVAAADIDKVIEGFNYKKSIKLASEICGPGIPIMGRTRAVSMFIPEDTLTKIKSPVGAYEAFAIYLDSTLALTQGAYDYFTRRLNKLKNVIEDGHDVRANG